MILAVCFAVPFCPFHCAQVRAICSCVISKPPKASICATVQPCHSTLVLGAVLAEFTYINAGGRTSPYCDLFSMRLTHGRGLSLAHVSVLAVGIPDNQV